MTVLMKSHISSSNGLDMTIILRCLTWHQEGLYCVANFSILKQCKHRLKTKKACRVSAALHNTIILKYFILLFILTTGHLIHMQLWTTCNSVIKITYHWIYLSCGSSFWMVVPLYHLSNAYMSSLSRYHE